MRVGSFALHIFAWALGGSGSYPSCPPQMTLLFTVRKKETEIGLNLITILVKYGNQLKIK